MATKRYEFQPPTNIVAIRSSILQRLKKRTSVITPPTPPPQANEYEEKLSFLHLDNGLPSPPIETCCFEEEEEATATATADMVVNVLMELSAPSSSSSPSLSSFAAPAPTNNTTTPVASTDKQTSAPVVVESSAVIRERIRLLKEEKHKLFQVMKDLLSTPPIKEEETEQEKARQQPSPVSANVNVNARPVIRSRSISHSESTRPISRYYDRPRFYNNNGYYPYQPSSSATVSYNDKEKRKKKN
ncbi:uncharacterized protein EV154DRAFT_79427 [Mucor mucedo]|uniref:uncharacterized protein n=1 Tax=Mucor mucedo TaxID=29922 RepID=UPI00221FAC88|nr:uncharacterized protein EV154DRAFT_79427 [Mucor mucedo]KAI7894512.1 hypothetical protein EV154DRAFT_79427 [Mucor mucedo]